MLLSLPVCNFQLSLRVERETILTMSENLVIIPTYKEKENIENIIRYVFNLPMAFDILIIDDNSPDGTAAIVKGLMTEFSDRLFLLERPGKLGLGTAYITGFKWALERDYQYFISIWKA